MKLKTTIGAIVIGLCAIGSAQANDACGTLEHAAEGIMKARQHGAPMSRIMAVASDSFEDAAMRQVMHKLIAQAYNMPRFSTKRFQDREISDFGNAVYLACYQQVD